MAQPLYRRIAAEIVRDIRSGIYMPGDQLPTVAAIRARWTVGDNTARRVGHAVTESGLAEFHGRGGLFVAGTPGPGVSDRVGALEAESARQAERIAELERIVRALQSESAPTGRWVNRPAGADPEIPTPADGPCAPPTSSPPPTRPAPT